MSQIHQEKRMSIRMCVWALSAAAGLSVALAQTNNTNTREFVFSPLAFGSTETAEINVVNVASNSSNGTAASCTGNILFRNAAGTTIGSATPFTLTSGQSTSAHLPFATATSTGGRALIRGVVQLTIPTATPRPPCALQFSLELYDTSTNATHFVVTGSGLSTPGSGRN
jgi:hypothetical protein